MQVCLSHLKKEMMTEILTKEVKNLLATRLNLKRKRKSKNLISINLVTAVLRIWKKKVLKLIMQMINLRSFINNPRLRSPKVRGPLNNKMSLSKSQVVLVAVDNLLVIKVIRLKEMTTLHLEARKQFQDYTVLMLPEDQVPLSQKRRAKDNRISSQ